MNRLRPWRRISAGFFIKSRSKLVLFRVENAWFAGSGVIGCCGLAATAGGLIVLAIVFVMREYDTAQQQAAEVERWQQRLEFVHRVEQEGRFEEARAILGRIPHGGSNDLHSRIREAQRNSIWRNVWMTFE